MVLWYGWRVAEGRLRCASKSCRVQRGRQRRALQLGYLLHQVSLHLLALSNVPSHARWFCLANALCSVDSTCDLGESHLSTNPGCLDRGNRAFSLWAMRNSARFVQRYYAAITDVFDTSALSLASIATTFIDNGKTDTQMGTNAWFIIMSGVIGATTAFIPGGGAAIGGTVAGIMGIGIGILGSAKAVAIDPRFTTFADMQARLGDIKTETQKTLSVYYNRMYRDTPAQGDIGAGTELSYLLESGACAYSKFPGLHDLC